MPHGRREVGAAAAPSRGAGSREVTSGLWDVALQCGRGVTEKRRLKKSQMAEKRHMQARW